ncbi:UNVERIFIED_CONTAM: hypothetical protein RMT77_001211 [Armadillidium vulgare]
MNSGVKFYFFLVLNVNLINVLLCYEEAPWMKHLDIVSSSSVPDDVQEEAVKGLVKRLLPNYESSFVFEVNRTYKDVNEICKITSPMSTNDSRVFIKATTGVAASWGLLYYLKNYCKASVSWEANQLELPDPLPQATDKIFPLYKFRYYQNVCTVSYSFAWWQWPQWERHIDWMALNGINFPLAFTGQEAIWRRVYKRFNFTDEDLNEHFVGPAFLAWGRMGNIKKWQGPLSDSWHKNTLALQHKILKRMREFGMIPILPAFAGHVPPALTRLYPNAKVTKLSAWGKFTSDSYTRTLFLDPRDSLFSQIGVAFIKEMEREFNGTDHFYNCDTFNEMTPSSGTTSYLRNVGKAVFKAMTTADTQAVWVMQGWIFKSGFWTYKRSKALLTSVTRGRMIILDLQSEASPQYGRLDSYFGQPFIFCLLQNFGGVDGLAGNFNKLLKNLQDAQYYPNVTLVGTGLTPEGINQNYVLYDFMLELPLSDVLPDPPQWIEKYSIRRYGDESPELKQAWKLLLKSVYNCNGELEFHGANNLIQHRPNFIRPSSQCYKISDLFKVWDYFVAPLFPESTINPSEIYEDLNMTESAEDDPHSKLTSFGTNETKKAFENSEEVTFENSNISRDDSNNLTQNDNNAIFLEDDNVFSSEINATKRRKSSSLQSKDSYRHDLVDITREVLQDIGGHYIETIRIAYLTQNNLTLRLTCRQLVLLFNELDVLLGASKNFLLGSWLQDALSWASNKQEEEQFLSNARYQITLWGPNGEILDYAAKQWNGVVRDYMLPR